MESVPDYQIIVLSKEHSHHPLISDMISLGRRLTMKGCGSGRETGEISVRYAKRIVITGGDKALCSLTSTDFLEVVDVDPHRRVVILIGDSRPSPWIFLHWLIYHLPWVHAILHLPDMIPHYPTSTVSLTGSRYDIPVDVLKNLKKDKCINMPGVGSVMVGRTLKEIENSLC
jgi:hypothetical protein